MAFVLFATGADVPSANVQVHQFGYIRANNAAELAEIRAAMPRLGYGVTPNGVTVFITCEPCPSGTAWRPRRGEATR